MVQLERALFPIRNDARPRCIDGGTGRQHLCLDEELRLERRREVVEFVHAHPELGHKEYECSAHLAEALASAGLEAERGIASMATAFRATCAADGPIAGSVVAISR
jgi:hypothetical protein